MSYEELVKGLLVPTLFGLGGFLGWLLKSRLEELKAVQAGVREQQRKTYLQILDPYIRAFADIGGKGAAQAAKMVVSYDYKRTAFELSLFGSDDVVRAWNALMQYFYRAAEQQESSSKEMLERWGGFLLEIRRDLGHKATRLDTWDMVRGLIKDVDKVKAA